MLRDELRVAQSLRDPAPRARRIDDGGPDGDRARQSAAADLVAGDDDGVLAQEPALECQARLHHCHDAGCSASVSGTPEKTS